MKFDFRSDQYKRSSYPSNMDYIKRIRAVSWFKRKLKFIIKVRRLKADVHVSYFKGLRANNIYNKYYDKLENLEKKESELRQREIAVLALENTLRKINN